MSGLIACACARGCSELSELLTGQSVVNHDVCNGCGDCIAVSSSHAIKMEALDRLTEELHQYRSDRIATVEKEVSALFVFVRIVAYA